VIFYLNFGLELVAATAVTVVAYVWVTRAITEWRTKLRREMNDLDGEALHRAVDSLLNYETVKYFGAEAREEARYSRPPAPMPKRRSSRRIRSACSTWRNR
jgi:ATP-binding cassette, subfamily B, heavy metal transporter